MLAAIIAVTKKVTVDFVYPFLGHSYFALVRS